MFWKLYFTFSSNFKIKISSNAITRPDRTPVLHVGQNSEAAHPANRKRRLLGTRHGQLLVLSCLTFGSCRICLPLVAPSGNHACWDFFLLVFLVPEDLLNWLEELDASRLLLLLLVVMRSFFFDVVSTPFVHLAALL